MSYVEFMVRFGDALEEKFQEYLTQEVNFGEDDHKTRMTERDAYFTGAYDMAKMTVPF